MREFRIDPAPASRSNLARMDAPAQPRFGSHMSAAGGLENAFDAARDVGCDSLQIFVRNQRQWNARPLSQDQIDRFRAAAGAKGRAVFPVVAHASYLLNLASPDRTMRDKSIAAMIDELTRCEALGVESLIFHPGAHMDEPLATGIKRIVASLNRVTAATSGFATLILLESTAGQGSSIGHTFDQLGQILAAAKTPQRLGVCLDTCHLFAAGYDFRTAEGYEAMVAELEHEVGAASVRCVHTNDSLKPCGSRVDRHAAIGKGCIGRAGFAHFVRDPRWAGLPFILETPKGEDERGRDLDKLNLAVLRRLTRR